MSDSRMAAIKNRAMRMGHGLRLMSAGLAAPLLVLAQQASATQITYNGFTITDGQLGSWQFHNAKVYLTMLADTSTAQTQSNYAGTGVTVSINTVGTAFVTIVTPHRVESAKFAPGQIFVAVDRGDDVDQPYVGGRGVGFGSVTATGIEPAYPLGIEDGTIDWGDASQASFALSDLSLDLTQPTGFSGRAWICVGFPFTCAAPNALSTDKGPLTLNQPYALACGACDPLTGGLFYAQSGHALPRVPEPEDTSTRRLRYTAALVSDVQVGNQFFANAFVQISMDADARNTTPFSDANGAGTINKGPASFKVFAGPAVISGWFAAGSIYAFFDSVNGSVGFGSASGRYYPLFITHYEDFNNGTLNGLVENSLMTAVWTFINEPANTTNFTAETAALVNWSGGTPGTGTASYTLQTPTVMSGKADSFPSAALKTTAGDFVLFADYIADGYSINWGLFWVEPAPVEVD